MAAKRASTAKTTAGKPTPQHRRGMIVFALRDAMCRDGRVRIDAGQYSCEGRITALLNDTSRLSKVNVAEGESTLTAIVVTPLGVREEVPVSFIRKVERG